MKKLISTALLLFTIFACSSEKNNNSARNCIKCGKAVNPNSIGYCNKHYTPEKELTLRGIKPNHSAKIASH